MSDLTMSDLTMSDLPTEEASVPEEEQEEDPPDDLTDMSSTILARSKCCVKNCGKKGHQTPAQDTLRKCSNGSCSKFIHVACYNSIMTSQNFDPVIAHDGSGELIICGTKKCYNQQTKLVMKMQKQAAAAAARASALVGIVARIGWGNDGPAGTEDPINSQQVLLDWLVTPGNYNKFRGGIEGAGTKKLHYAERIVARIRAAGIRTERTAKDVLSKISHIEDKWKKAHDWSTSVTGAGLEVGDVGTFKSSVLQKCQWYFELAKVMGDRAMAGPKATNEDFEFEDTEAEGAAAAAATPRARAGKGDTSVIVVHDEEDSSGDDDFETPSGKRKARVDSRSEDSSKDKKKKANRYRRSPDPDAASLYAATMQQSDNRAVLQLANSQKQFDANLKMEERRLKMEEAKELRVAAMDVQMMEMEKTKVEVEKTKEARKEKMARFDQYRHLRTGGATDAYVLKVFPELEDFVVTEEAGEESEGE